MSDASPGLRKLVGGIRILHRVEEFLLSWMVLLIAGLTIANITSRVLLGDSLAFTEELSQFLIIGVTFIGLSHAAGRARHIRMTALYDQLSLRWRKVLTATSAGTTSLLLLLLGGYAIRYIETVRFLETVSPVLQVPMYLVYLVVPLGLWLAAAQYALAVARNLTADEVYLSFEVKDEYEEPVVGET